MQIKDSAISRIAIPYRGTCRGAARRIASLTALDGPSMRTKPLRGHMRLLAAPSRVMSSCSFFDRGVGVIVAWLAQLALRSHPGRNAFCRSHSMTPVHHARTCTALVSAMPRLFL
jgi:hypothetical protein